MKSIEWTVESTFTARASRRSGLKSVNPELLMMRSSWLRNRAEVSRSSPNPGCETSPSTTSTFSASSAPSRLPYFSNNGSKTGDASIIFSKRVCAGFDFCRRINKYSFPISGKSISVFASHTLPINPVTPISITCFPPSTFRTENRAGYRFSSKYTIGRTRGVSTRTAGAIAEVEAIRNNPPYAQMARQRAHHMLQPLAHQHHVDAGCLQRLQVPHPFFFEQRLQLVLEFFFAQQIEAVASNSAQHGVHDSSCGHAVRRIQKWPQQRHEEHQAAAYRSRDISLAVPGEESDGTDGGQLEQASFHPPVNRRGRARPNGLGDGRRRST